MDQRQKTEKAVAISPNKMYKAQLTSSGILRQGFGGNVGLLGDLVVGGGLVGGAGGPGLTVVSSKPQACSSSEKNSPSGHFPC